MQGFIVFDEKGGYFICPPDNPERSLPALWGAIVLSETYQTAINQYLERMLVEDGEKAEVNFVGLISGTGGEGMLDDVNCGLIIYFPGEDLSVYDIWGTPVNVNGSDLEIPEAEYKPQ